MNAAPRPRKSRRLLVLDPHSHSFGERSLAELPQLLPPKALVVVNESGTWPASLTLVTATGEPLEARFFDVPTGRAVLFGAGDWRTSTEGRPPPPELSVGDLLTTSGGRQLVVDAIADRYAQMVPVGESLARILLAEGKPVQYSYLERDLRPHEVQSPIAGPPTSSEMPSASRILSVEGLLTLRRAGFDVVSLQHGAGLSAVGPAELDRTLPWPERFAMSQHTWAVIQKARQDRRPIVAVGTTVARALEGASAPGGITDHVLGHDVPLRVVDAIVTGVHDLDSSHHHLLQAFVDPALLRGANAFGAGRGFLGHEFGDFTLVAPGALRKSRAEAAA